MSLPFYTNRVSHVSFPRHPWYRQGSSRNFGSATGITHFKDEANSHPLEIIQSIITKNSIIPFQWSLHFRPYFSVSGCLHLASVSRTLKEPTTNGRSCHQAQCSRTTEKENTHTHGHGQLANSRISVTIKLEWYSRDLKKEHTLVALCRTRFSSALSGGRWSEENLTNRSRTARIDNSIKWRLEDAAHITPETNKRSITLRGKGRKRLLINIKVEKWATRKGLNYPWGYQIYLVLGTNREMLEGILFIRVYSCVS